MARYAVAAGMFCIWGVAVLLGKGGFIHILLLSAFAIFIVELAAHRRAMQRVKIDP